MTGLLTSRVTDIGATGPTMRSIFSTERNMKREDDTRTASP